MVEYNIAKIEMDMSGVFSDSMKTYKQVHFGTLMNINMTSMKMTSKIRKN